MGEGGRDDSALASAQIPKTPGHSELGEVPEKEL